MNLKQLCLIFIVFFAPFMVYAEDLVRKSCPNDDCGTMIIGGAHVIPDAVKWNGTGSIGITLHSSNEGFGFIGKTSFRKDGVNSWSLIMPYEVRATALSSQGPAMGFYFSPYFTGDTSTTITYETSALANADATKTVSGKAILDDATNSAITLKANIKQNYTVKPCQDKSNCQEVEVPSNQMVTFQIVPVVDDSRVSQLGGAKLSYAQISLDITENKQNCPPYPPSFRDSATANYDPNNYFDMIWGLDFMYPVGFQQQCDRKRSFLASANKPFEFSATAIGTTLTGSYAQYLFYIAGHYDENDLSKYASSYQIFRLRSGDFTTTQPTTTNQPPTASFIITKSGTVVDSVKVGETVTLDASQSSDPEKGNLTYQWSSNPAINIPPVQKPSVSFTAKDNYKISLAVADDKGATSTTLSQYISISDNIAPSETFTLTTNVNPVNPVSSGTISRNLTGQIAKDVPVTLTATPNSGFEFDFWSKDCNGTESKQNPLTITIAKSTTCTANFKLVQTQPTGDLKACFKVQSDPDNPKQKILDASCTEANTANVTYNWIIYHLNSEPVTPSMPSGKQPIQKFEYGKHTIVLIASVGEELSVSSESIIVASTPPTTVFDNQLKINAETSATKVSLKNVGSIPSEVAETISTHPIKYLWFSKSRNGKLGEGLELQNIDLQYTGKDVVTLIAYNDADYIKSVSQVITLLQESNPDPGINNISPKKQQFDAASSLDNQSVVFMLDGSISEDPDNTPDPTKGIKQYKWKWEVSSILGDLPAADKSFSESPPFFINNVFSGESQQFKFTLKVVDDENVESGSGVSRITVKKPSAKFTAPRLVEAAKDFILNITEPTSPSEYKLDTTVLDTDNTLNYRWIITDSQGIDVSSTALRDNSNPTRPKMKITSKGVYTLTLAVVDNYGLYQKTQPVQLTVEDSANLKLLDNDSLTKIASGGTTSSVDNNVVSFESGIAVQNENQQYGDFLLNQEAKVGTDFKLRSRISSNQEQMVDLLLVVGIEPQEPLDGGIDTNYHSYDSTGNLVTKNGILQRVDLYGAPAGDTGWIAQLISVPFAQNVVLTPSGLLIGIEGKFLGAAGKYYFFTGYVQLDGTIVYSKNPVQVMVK